MIRTPLALLAGLVAAVAAASAACKYDPNVPANARTICESDRSCATGRCVPVPGKSFKICSTAGDAGDTRAEGSTSDTGGAAVDATPEALQAAPSDADAATGGASDAAADSLPTLEAGAGEQIFVATLSGAEAKPTTSSASTGTATFVLNAAKTMVAYTLRHDVVATAAHLHTGFGGETGPVSVALRDFGAEASGTLAATPGLAAALETGQIYLDLHAAAFPDGEVRGQLLRPGETLYEATLSGAEHVPPVATKAVGSASFVLSAAKTTLRYHLRHTIVSAATATYLIAGGPGERPALQLPLAQLSSGGDGTAMLTPAAAADLEAGRIYVDVQSVGHLEGELRGQLVRPGETVFVARLRGPHNSGPVASAVTGVAGVILGAGKRSIRYRIVTANLAPTAAHVHRGLATQAGPEVFPLSTVAAAMNGAFEGTQPVTATDVADLDAGILYVELHPNAQAGGEIRGQLTRPGTKIFVADLTGAQEVPAVATAHTGAAMVLLAPDAGSIRYHVSTTAAPTLAHVHKAPGGVAGPVEIPISPVSAKMTGTAGMTPAHVADLERGLHYINIHTTAFGAGELRGQLLGLGETLYTSSLSGADEVPPVITNAAGGIGYILNAAGTQLRYDGTLTGLAATTAHVHTGALGVNGPVLFTLTIGGATVTGTQAVAAADVQRLDAAGAYANVHTAAQPSGEIRGQVLRR